MKETFGYKNQSIILDDVTISYHNYTIKIYSKDYINVERYYNPIPFIYSNEQFIDIKRDIDLYELKFKIGIYNEDI